MNGHLIRDTPIAVDFWNIRKCASVSLFFLTHIHSDHTVGLTSSWSRPIYCSKVTGELLCEKISLPDDLIRPLELDSPTLIPMNPSHTEMLTVTALDANHCPGAVMFLFQGYFGTILYTGDFRYTTKMFINSPLGNIFVDVLYLDNTYCDPLCNFAPREEVKEKIFEIMQSYPEHDILFGMQSLGKPDLLVSIAMHFKEYIAVPPAMFKFFEIIEVPNVFQIDSPEHECRLRVVPTYYVSKKLFKNLNRPTIVILVTAIYEGLEGTPYSNQDSVYVVPYSDHSSYVELQDFVKRVQPGRIVPIIGTEAKGPFNISFAKRANMSCFDQFLSKNSQKPFTISAGVDLSETRTVCHSDVILPICKKPRRSISVIGTKSVKAKGVVFESPPRKSRNNKKDVPKNVPENDDNFLDTSESPQREAMDLSTTVPVSKNFPQTEEKSAVSGGECETTADLEIHWRQRCKKRKLILDSKQSCSNRTLDPETCTRASTADSDPKLDSQTDTPNLNPGLSTRTNKPNLDPDLGSQTNTPNSGPHLSTQTNKPNLDPDLGSQTNTPNSGPHLSTRTNKPNLDPDLGSQTNTPNSGPHLSTRTNKPNLDPDLGSQTNTPNSGPHLSTRTNKPNLDPDLGSQTNTPNSDHHLSSRTNKPNLNPDSDTNELSLISDSCSGESSPKTSQWADFKILNNKINDMIAENHSDLSSLPGGSKSERDCHVQAKPSGGHPSLLPNGVQKSARNSEEKEISEKDASSTNSSQISTVYGIQPEFPSVKLKKISTEPEIPKRKRKLPSMFHEEFQSLQKRRCCDFFKLNTRREQERTGVSDNQIPRGVEAREVVNNINDDVTGETSAGHLPTFSETRPVRSMVFASSISDYVGQFDTPSGTILSCQAIFSKFVRKQRLMYKSKTSAVI